MALAVLASVPALTASPVYKWVDDSGQVHYQDRPPHPGASPLTVPAAPPKDTALEAHLRIQRKYLRAREEERAQRRQAAAEAQQQRRHRQAQCALARRQLFDIERAQYLYRPGPEGERTVVSDAERAAATGQARDAVAFWCG
jgi:hypothetical protein